MTKPTIMTVLLRHPIALAGMLAFASFPALAQFKESTEGCLFSVAELQAAIGHKFEAGRGTLVAAAGTKRLSCTYPGPIGKGSVTLTMDRMDSPAAINPTAAMAGKAEPVPGDPDKAFWQVGQGDLTDVSLTYVRGSTRTQVRVSGVNQKDKAAVEAMRAKVLKLRRVS